MLEPMLASLADAPFDDPTLVYEPKYDGIRAIVDVPAGGVGVRLWSRLGNDKTAQFQEIADALSKWARTRREPVVLDGEIVALDERGNPSGFQRLQGRIHLKGIVASRRYRGPGSAVASARAVEREAVPEAKVSTAFIAFDILRDGSIDLRGRPLTERRGVLERVFAPAQSALLRLSEQSRDGRALYARAKASGWEGLIAKRAASRYLSGKRTPDWRKLKIVHEQDFVIGGWTEPRSGGRLHFGSLILGVYNGKRLAYSGHVGTGFNEAALSRLMKLLKPLGISESPFDGPVPTNERPHWVKPALVAQVKFSEWTDDSHLRHPVYLGLRDDKKAADVTREEMPTDASTSDDRSTSAPARAATGSRSVRARKTVTAPKTMRSRVRDAGSTRARTAEVDALVAQLKALEASRKDGTIELGNGQLLAVTNLHKVFWPSQKLTKGDLLRYYATVSPMILPVLADRPLIMKRFPNGVDAKPFYQHHVDTVPDGVRALSIRDPEPHLQIVGGDLLTLLYTAQLASISQDPWFSRTASLDATDFVAFDLDPADGVSFKKVLDVARWLRDVLAKMGAQCFAKTSGADGAHVYVRMPPDTPYEAGVLFAQIVATVVAHAHPKEATLERSVRARGKRVYIDCLQNARGKSLASAYSARASTFAGVSTPLTWQEVDDGVNREDFTIVTVPGRLRDVGDLWAGLRTMKPVDLARVTRTRK